MPNKEYLKRVLDDLHDKLNQDNLTQYRHGHSEHYSYSSLNTATQKAYGGIPSNSYGLSGLIALQRGKGGYVKIDRSVLGKTSSGPRSKATFGDS